MNNTALRIENGMSSFELLQAKVSSLEATEKRMSIEEDRRYIEYSEIGLHYYKFDTLIKFFENFKHENGAKKALITFSKNNCLQCEPVRD